MTTESPSEEQIKELHVKARQTFIELQEKDLPFDKKQLRYNDIVSVGVFYGQCGWGYRQEVAMKGVVEAVESCFLEITKGKPNPLFVSKGSVLSLVQDWMRS